jgi:hypothetical protein
VAPAGSGSVSGGTYQIPCQWQIEGGSSYASIQRDATNYRDIGYEVAERKLVIGRLSLCCRMWVVARAGNWATVDNAYRALEPVGARMQ